MHSNMHVMCAYERALSLNSLISIIIDICIFDKHACHTHVLCILRIFTSYLGISVCAMCSIIVMNVRVIGFACLLVHLSFVPLGIVYYTRYRRIKIYRKLLPSLHGLPQLYAGVFMNCLSTIQPNTRKKQINFN